jgi:hypothetical protein
MTAGDGISPTYKWSARFPVIKSYATATINPGAIPAYGSAPAAATITLGASPATYTNADGVPETVIFTGGTTSIFTLTRGGFTSATLGTTTPFTAMLYPGDAVNVTYSVAPTVQEKLLWGTAGGQFSTTITVPNEGAAVGDGVIALPGTNLGSLDYTASVTAANTITLTITNSTSASFTPSSSTWGFLILYVNDTVGVGI